MALQNIRLTVNGQPYERQVEPRKSLADFIRQDLLLTGTHVGCEHGVCGSCTVLYNGEPIRSCIMLAVQAHGSEILTVEGLAENGKLHPLQESFKKFHALQCGFCTPGFLLTAHSLLKDRPILDEEAVRHALSGNLCRCTGYQNIVKAVLEAGKESQGLSQSQVPHDERNGPNIGRPFERKEDSELVKGKGVFVDDIEFPGMLYAAVVRSPYAHARIGRIDKDLAGSSQGVVEVISFSDLGDATRFPVSVPHPALKPLTEYPLARDKVRYVGEPVAVVVALSRPLAEDAADLVEVEYEPLEACVDIEKALAPGAPLIHETEEDNLAFHMVQKVGDVEKAFSQADFVFKETLRVHRAGCHAIETRGVIAQFDAKTGFLNIWASTQGPHRLRKTLLKLLKIPEHKVRVIAPRVGGGFGPKGGFYPEHYLIPWLAIRLGRPIKWIEDRREHCISTRQEGDQTHEVEVAVKKEGTIVGFRDSFLYETGGYSTSAVVPWITLATLPGPYKIPNLYLEVRSVFTNKVPRMVVRGAGRPQAAFVMEKMITRIASGLGLDPAEVRFRNFIRPEDFPYSVGILYRDNNPLVYDSGNYPACLEKALAMVDYRNFRESRINLRKNGTCLGIGIGAYVEGTGFGPYEGAKIKVNETGEILVFTGAPSQGQGQETALAQICADYLGVDFKDIQVMSGDTADIPYGVGTFASRSMVTAGNAVARAASQLREKALKIASSVLECDSDDLTIAGGEIFVKGSPGKRLQLKTIATEMAGRVSGFSLGEDIEPGLECTVYFSPRRATHSSGVHVAVVSVDEETGEVKIIRYIVVHDCGRIINPMLVDGQVHGGVAHGIGNALYEEVVLDKNGQVLNTSFMDYLIPGPMEVPPIEVAHVETPSPLNPLGCKGAGEGGTIPSPAAIVLAIEDALSDFGIIINRIPVRPEHILKSIQQAKSL